MTETVGHPNIIFQSDTKVVVEGVHSTGAAPESQAEEEAQNLIHHFWSRIEKRKIRITLEILD